MVDQTSHCRNSITENNIKYLDMLANVLYAKTLPCFLITQIGYFQLTVIAWTLTSYFENYPSKVPESEESTQPPNVFSFLVCFLCCLLFLVSCNVIT